MLIQSTKLKERMGRRRATRQRAPWVNSRTKRAIDLTLTALALPVALPLAGVAAGASALAFRTSPIFRQERRGLDGTTFTVFKLRSLPTDFPSQMGRHHLDHSDLPLFSRVLRASHADELPQLLNVLRGEMSLVGPRPMIDEVLSHLPADLRAARQRVLPGMTGPWQVSTMGGRALHECPDLDVMYVEHASLLHDVRYLFWTVARKSSPTERHPEALRRSLRRVDECVCVGCRPFHLVPENPPVAASGAADRTEPVAAVARRAV